MAETTPLDRAQFAVAQKHRYLNHAGIGPLPSAAVAAMCADGERMAREGSLAIDERSDRVEEIRATAARALGAPSTDVAFVKNTTEGLAFVANGLTWQPGDRVIVPDLEFPSTIYPWLALRDQGVTVDFVEPVGTGRTLPLEAFEDALTAAPTRLVALSWVQFGRGWRTDIAGLAKLCHDHGALLCVDVIQGLGVMPCSLDAWGVDFAAADGHKWLLGPEGIGVLYVAERHHELLRVLEPGWASVAHRMEWDNLELVYDASARRFEGGTPNVVGTMGLGASLDRLEAAGVKAVWAHVERLTDRLCDGLHDAGAHVLSDRSPDGRSGIVVFSVPGVDPPAVVEHLAAQRIVCSPRGGGIRLAPHGYNDESDIDAAVAAVRALRV